MRVVDTETYALYTGDRSTDADTVEEALDDAIQLLEERLDRTLALGTHTERLPVVAEADTGTHVVYPACVPLVSTTAGTIRGNAIRGVTRDGGVFSIGDWATVTYLGGFTPDTLPIAIRRDICGAARKLLDTQTPSVVPAGAKVVRVGDVSLDYGPDGAGAPAAGGYPWSPDTLVWRRRTL